MKKLLLILVLCLSTIGLAGCGSSAPTKVDLTFSDTNAQKSLEVGKDIKAGQYSIKYNGNKNANYYIGSTKEQSTQRLLTLVKNNSGNDVFTYCERLGTKLENDQTNTLELKDNDVLFITSYEGEITLSK